MAKEKADRASVPTAWVDCIRRCWGRLHTVQCAYRSSPNGTWEVAYAVAIPDKVDDKKVDAAVCLGHARDAWSECWDHLEKEADSKGHRRGYFKLQCYALDKNGALVLAEETGIGGKIDIDNPGSVEDSSTGDEEAGLVRSLIKERESMVSQVIRLTTAVASLGEKCGLLFENAAKMMEKGNEAAIQDAYARAEEARMHTAMMLGVKLIEAKAPAWKAEAEAKLKAKASEKEADLATLCRYAAHCVDGPTAMRWEQVFDWRAVVAVLYTAGEKAGWEENVKTVMKQLSGREDIWKAASATCVAAFHKVAQHLGLVLD